jgi:phage antirepressor YoqD-like protein
MNAVTKNPSTIRVENVDLPTITHQNKRVVTTALLAELYGTEVDNLQKNFARNAERFSEGEHYFKLEGAELKAFKSLPTTSRLVDKFAPSLLLWTDRGAARHSKILDTDQAWQVFDKLEEAYFNPTTAQPALNPANFSRMQLIELAMQAEQDHLAEKAKREAAEAVIAEQAPKVAALDRLSGAEGSLCITDTAKALQHQPKKLFAFLSEDHWIYKRAGGKHWLGYQDKIQNGLLEHKTTTVTRSDGSEKVVEQVLVTPKGLTKLAKLLNERRIID